MTPSPTEAVLCPRCSQPLRALSVSTGDGSGAMTVRARCATCNTEWTYPHWDPLRHAARTMEPIVVTECGASSEPPRSRRNAG